MAGRRYSVEATNAVASPTVTALTVSGTSAVRPTIYDVDVGSSATPADNALIWKMQRFTAPGTNTAYVPPPLDTGDPAATSPCGITNTIEPTYTSAKVLWHIALNQRATHRFNFDPAGCLVIPATASNGIGLYCVNSSFTGNTDSLCYFFE